MDASTARLVNSSQKLLRSIATWRLHPRLGRDPYDDIHLSILVFNISHGHRALAISILTQRLLQPEGIRFRRSSYWGRRGDWLTLFLAYTSNASAFSSYWTEGYLADS